MVLLGMNLQARNGVIGIGDVVREMRTVVGTT
jgi:hypothetical protein